MNEATADSTNTNSTKKPSPFARTLSALAILLVVWGAYSLWRGGTLAEGSRAPTWQLPRAGGSNSVLDLETLRGQVVVLDFWSLYCPPCIRQIEDLEAVRRKLKNRGVTVIGVTVNVESKSEIDDFIQRRNPDYPIVIDTQNVAATYRVQTLPTLYIIDRAGNIARAHRGYWDHESLSREIGKLL